MSKTIRMAPPGTGPTAEVDAKAEALIEQLISGRYRLEQVIASSETGAVYRAEHVAMRMRVVVKILHPGAPADGIARFEREAVAGAHVRHANVAAATDFGKLEDGSHFLVVEHVAGTTLREVLRKGRLPLSRALSVARQLAAGLSAAHEQGIVHRDVQPDNVMLSGPAGDQVKLIDFGLAKVDLPADAGGDGGGAGGQHGKALTTFGVRVGLGAYSPPEGQRGLNALDARSDLYSLGMVLYEMLAGRRPFTAEEPDELFAEQRRVEPPPLPPDLDVPASLEATITRLLHRDPAKRYASAQDAMEAIVAAVPDSPPARSFAPRRPPSPGTMPAFFERTQDLARGALRGAVELGGRAAGRIGKIASTRVGEKRRVPVWALAAIVSVPLLSTLLWLALRSPAGLEASGPSPPVTRFEAPPAPSTGPAPAEVASVAGASRGASSAAASDSAALRSRLRELSAARDWGRAAKVLDALVKADPEALRDPQIGPAVMSVAVALETTGGDDADAVFDLLSMHAEVPGLEVLFEIVRSRGGTKGSKRAAALLRKPEVSARLPKPLRVAFELRDAPCDKKPSLYTRAVEEGDHLALTELRVMREAQCDRRRSPDDPCCFDKAPLDQAIKDLRAKLAK